MEQRSVEKLAFFIFLYALLRIDFLSMIVQDAGMVLRLIGVTNTVVLPFPFTPFIYVAIPVLVPAARIVVAGLILVFSVRVGRSLFHK